MSAGWLVLIIPGRGAGFAVKVLTRRTEANPPATTTPAAIARGLRSGNSSAMIATTGVMAPPTRVTAVAAHGARPELRAAMNISTSAENRLNVEKTALICLLAGSWAVVVSRRKNCRATEMTSAAIAQPRNVRNICTEPTNNVAPKRVLPRLSNALLADHESKEKMEDFERSMRIGSEE